MISRRCASASTLRPRASVRRIASPAMTVLPDPVGDTASTRRLPAANALEMSAMSFA
jgi:hypothetical protein